MIFFSSYNSGWNPEPLCRHNGFMTRITKNTTRTIPRMIFILNWVLQSTFLHAVNSDLDTVIHMVTRVEEENHVALLIRQARESGFLKPATNENINAIIGTNQMPLAFQKLASNNNTAKINESISIISKLTKFFHNFLRTVFYSLFLRFWNQYRKQTTSAEQKTDMIETRSLKGGAN